MDPAELSRAVDRELARLPAPRAPHTLLPRVLAAVDEWSTRPWYTRAWFTWPLAWQTVSLMALALVVTGAALLVPSAYAAASVPLARLSVVTHDIAYTAHYVDALANAGVVIWRVIVEPVAGYALAVTALMALTCVGLSTVVNRLALGRF